jgi:regulator of sigma E protease
LLPLPALDGGRALFLGLEALIRRRINPRIEATVHTVGLVVLLGVLLLVSFKDFTRLIGKG